MEKSLQNSYEDDEELEASSRRTCSAAEKDLGTRLISASELNRDGNGATPEEVAAAAASASSAAIAHHNSVGCAKYKLMSPAKLPISRSPCTLTIPPGLSPTSFLESPVLLSNIKVREVLFFLWNLLVEHVFFFFSSE